MTLLPVLDRRLQLPAGLKVELAMTNKESFVLAATALAGNPYDGYTLQMCLF
jgi:hypothetical protein